MQKYIAMLSQEVNSLPLEGFQLMSENEMNYYLDLCENIMGEITYELGDDKEMFFSDGMELLSSIEFNEISDAEFKALSRVFQNGRFGTFISEQFLVKLSDIEDEEELDEEDLEDEEDDDY